MLPLSFILSDAYSLIESGKGAMYYGLVHYPDVNTRLIGRIRGRYDPTARMIAPHIPILFPLPDEIGESVLISHTENILKSWKPFPIHIHGLFKSWDHWLMLAVEEGNEAVRKLHREIYSGILSKYRRKDIEYIPHIALGLFVKSMSDYSLKNPQKTAFDSDAYEKAVHETSMMKPDFRALFDRLQLVRIKHHFTKIENRLEFLLEQISGAVL